MRVLVAEDESLTRRVLEGALIKWGYDVLVCRDGAEAWDTLQRPHAPELVLLDWMMPGIDGLDVCRRVRGMPDSSLTYIIVLTSKKRRDDLIAVLDIGADDYVTKPFDPLELRARIRVGERVVKLQKERLESASTDKVNHPVQAIEEMGRSRARLVRAHEEARKAIADQLRGLVEDQLYTLWLRLEEVRNNLADSPNEAKTELAQVAFELDSLRRNEIAQISNRLHPGIINLVCVRHSALSETSTGAQSQPVSKSTARGRQREPPGRSTIPHSVRLGLYRVAEAAFAKVVENAQATQIIARLWLSGDDTICLQVQDNGVECELDDGSGGLGWIAMVDYLEAIRGSFELDAVPGEGTKVTATLPLQAKAVSNP